MRTIFIKHTKFKYLQLKKNIRKKMKAREKNMLFCK